MLGNLTTDSKKQQLEIQDLKERLLSEDTISTFEKNRTLSQKIEEVKLMLEATSTSNLQNIIFDDFGKQKCIFLSDLVPQNCFDYGNDVNGYHVINPLKKSERSAKFQAYCQNGKNVCVCHLSNKIVKSIY